MFILLSDKIQNGWMNVVRGVKLHLIPGIVLKIADYLFVIAFDVGIGIGAKSSGINEFFFALLFSSVETKNKMFRNHLTINCFHRFSFHSLNSTDMIYFFFILWFMFFQTKNEK